MLQAMDRGNEELLYPVGMELRLNATDTVYVEQSIATVWRNLGLGALLATLVMFLFLRSTRMTLVGMIGIPAPSPRSSDCCSPVALSMSYPSPGSHFPSA